MSTFQPGNLIAAFPQQDCGKVAFFRALRIENQSLPWGKCCLPPIEQVGNCAQHQSISCEMVLPPIPRVFTVSGERVALFPCSSESLIRESASRGIRQKAAAPQTR